MIHTTNPCYKPRGTPSKPDVEAEVNVVTEI